MSGFLMGLTMFICIMPVLFILYFSMYPRTWKNKSRVYGVNNRAEYKSGKSEEFINLIVQTHNKQATVILAILFIVSVILLFLPGFTIKMIAWTVFIYIALFAFTIPYILGNSEMKKYKKAMGIINEQILYADLKNAGGVHALSKPHIIIANIFGIAVLIVSVLIDSGIVSKGFGIFQNTYICTAMVGSIIFINLIFLPIAFIIDYSRNIVISENSDINANYNRARKKVYADYNISITWFNDIVSIIALIIFMLLRSEIAVIVFFGLYLVVIMSLTGMLFFKGRSIEQKYLSDKTEFLEDDDDKWIFGIFYYNPLDKKLNVEKRVGIGWTVNMAHPVGKILGFIGILSIVASIMALIWIAMMSSTPIKIINDGDYIVCHHLWDEYKIAIEDILSAEYGDQSALKTVRTAGTGMENVAKGTFNVNGQNGCKLFLNPQCGKYIMIETKDKTYYISDNTIESTKELYQEIRAELPVEIIY